MILLDMAVKVLSLPLYHIRYRLTKERKKNIIKLEEEEDNFAIGEASNAKENSALKQEIIY